MTDPKTRRAAYAWVAEAIDNQLEIIIDKVMNEGGAGGFPDPLWHAVHAIRDAMAAAGAIEDEPLVERRRPWSENRKPEGNGVHK